MCWNISTRLLMGVNPIRLESATNNVSPANAMPPAPPSSVLEAPWFCDVNVVWPITSRAACPVMNCWAKAAPAHSEKRAQYLSIDGSERDSYQYNNLLTFHPQGTLRSTADDGPNSVDLKSRARTFSYLSKVMLVAVSNLR